MVEDKAKLRRSLGKECVYCGCNNPLMFTVDHILPKVRGGIDNKENMQLCCWYCNQLKGGLTDKEFRKYLRALKILCELKKIRIVFPTNGVQLKFNQNYIPELPIHMQPLKESGKNDRK